MSKQKQHGSLFDQKAFDLMPYNMRNPLFEAIKKGAETRENAFRCIARINQAVTHPGFDLLDHGKQIDFLDALSTTKSPQERNTTWEFYLGNGEIIAKPKLAKVTDITSAPSAPKPKKAPAKKAAAKTKKVTEEKKPVRRRTPLKAAKA